MVRLAELSAQGAVLEPQLIYQPSVVDGDRRLIGHGLEQEQVLLHQFRLLLRIHIDDTHHLFPGFQRHAEHRADDLCLHALAAPEPFIHGRVGTEDADAPLDRVLHNRFADLHACVRRIITLPDDFGLQLPGAGMHQKHHPPVHRHGLEYHVQHVAQDRVKLQRGVYGAADFVKNGQVTLIAGEMLEVFPQFLRPERSGDIRNLDRQLLVVLGGLNGLDLLGRNPDARLFCLVDEDGLADAEFVAIHQLMAVDWQPVHKRAVAALEIHDRRLLALDHDLGVQPGDHRVEQGDVGSLVPPDHGLRLAQCDIRSGPGAFQYSKRRHRRLLPQSTFLFVRIRRTLWMS